MNMNYALSYINAALVRKCHTVLFQKRASSVKYTNLRVVKYATPIVTRRSRQPSFHPQTMNNLHVSLTEFRNESRVLKETKSITEAGIAKHVYVASLHAPDQSEHESISDKVTLNRISLWTRRLPKKSWAHAAKYIEFSFRILFKYRKCDIGIINIHHIALLPLGILLKYFYGAVLVYDTHELETEVEGLHGLQKTLLKLVEKTCVGYCDQIFVVSEKIADWYVEAYGGPRPVVVFNSPLYKEHPRSDKLRKTLGIPAETVIFLYQGGFFEGRGIEIILETFESLSDTRASVVFMGYGPLIERIQTASYAYRNIYFHPAVPPGDLLNYTASADVGLSLIEGSCLSYLYSMPNKLFEYTMAGLPVIVSNMPEMATYVTENCLGVVMEAHSRVALLEAIKRLKNSNLDLLKHNAHITSKAYSWEVQEQKMLRAYRELLDRKA